MKISAILIATAASTSLASSAGCAKDKEATCAKAISHYMSLLDTEQARDADRERLQKARVNRPALQNTLVKSCDEQKWSPATRTCIMDAKAPSDLVACAPATAGASLIEPDGSDPAR